MIYQFVMADTKLLVVFFLSVNTQLMWHIYLNLTHTLLHFNKVCLLIIVIVIIV